MYKKVLIVCSETSINLQIFNNNENFIIGVERGCLELINKKIKIDLAISDFDNVLKEELLLIKNNSKKIQILNKQKDFLDGEEAVLFATKNFPNSQILFISKPTKRYDMAFSIINLVKKYGIKFLNDDTLIIKLKPKKNELNFTNYQHFTYFSFFSFERSKISIRNMKYNVEKFDINPFDNMCISNSLEMYKNPEIECDNELIMIATK